MNNKKIPFETTPFEDFWQSVHAWLMMYQYVLGGIKTEHPDLPRNATKALEGVAEDLRDRLANADPYALTAGGAVHDK